MIPATMHLLERALSTLPNIESNTIIADGSGIHWKTIHRTAELVKYVSEHSPHSQGTFNFTATAMLKPLSPFFPGSYHTGAGRQFAIGFEGANVVRDVFTKDKGNADAATADLTAALAKHAAVADAIGRKVAAETGWSYVGVDPTPAPLGDVSIGVAIEAFTGAKFGSSGTLTAARIITRGRQGCAAAADRLLRPHGASDGGQTTSASAGPRARTTSTRCWHTPPSAEQVWIRSRCRGTSVSNRWSGSTLT